MCFTAEYMVWNLLHVLGQWQGAVVIIEALILKIRKPWHGILGLLRLLFKDLWQCI